MLKFFRLVLAIIVAQLFLSILSFLFIIGVIVVASTGEQTTLDDNSVLHLHFFSIFGFSSIDHRMKRWN